MSENHLRASPRRSSPCKGLNPPGRRTFFVWKPLPSLLTFEDAASKCAFRIEETAITIMDVKAAPPMVPPTPNFEVMTAAAAEAIPPARTALPLMTPEFFLASLTANKNTSPRGSFQSRRRQIW